MAKQRQRSKQHAPATDKREAKVRARREASRDARRAPLAARTAPAEQPRFWFGFEVTWAKLLLARVVLFALLAIDAVLSIRHAPRYGAGGFNVAHLPGLDALGPTRASYAIAQLVSAYLFVLVAFGVGTRYALPVVTAIYAWLYFGSQLDSYQHHYLVVLLLLLACFVPWQRPADATPATPVRSWAVRLMLVQLGIMYLWAAISKLDVAWLDGRTLHEQITGSLRHAIDATIGITWTARLVVVTELVLAVIVWVRPAWIVAAPLGIAFHAGILKTGLEIGLFAWLMLGLYVLVVPDRIWVWIAETPPLRVLRAVLGRVAAADSWIALGLGALGTALALATRLHHAVAVAVGLAVFTALIVVTAKRRGERVGPVGIAHVVAIAVWLLVDRASTVAFDYYNFWGGSQRRLGKVETAEVAYRELAERFPDDARGHYRLGELLVRRNDLEGLGELHEAQRLEPLQPRAYMAEAEYLARTGKQAEAIAKAQEATYADPSSQAARDLVDRLTGAGKPATPAAADDDPDDAP